jgi:hypothetical protein
MYGVRSLLLIDRATFSRLESAVSLNHCKKRDCSNMPSVCYGIFLLSQEEHANNKYTQSELLENACVKSSHRTDNISYGVKTNRPDPFGVLLFRKLSVRISTRIPLLF